MKHRPGMFTLSQREDSLIIPAAQAWRVRLPVSRVAPGAGSRRVMGDGLARGARALRMDQALRRTRAKAPAGAGRRLAREAVRGAPRVRLGGGPRGHPLGGRELGRPVPLAARGGVACHPGRSLRGRPAPPLAFPIRGVSRRAHCVLAPQPPPPARGLFAGHPWTRATSTPGRARAGGREEGGESGPAPQRHSRLARGMD